MLEYMATVKGVAGRASGRQPDSHISIRIADEDIYRILHQVKLSAPCLQSGGRITAELCCRGGTACVVGRSVRGGGGRQDRLLQKEARAFSGRGGSCQLAAQGCLMLRSGQAAEPQSPGACLFARQAARGRFPEGGDPTSRIIWQCSPCRGRTDRHYSGFYAAPGCRIRQIP